MSHCERHRAFLYDRGGERRIGELTQLRQVRWGRSRDDTSIGNVFVKTPDATCSRVVAEIEPGRHELVIFRGGQRVWEGPIVRTDETGDRIEVDARDITHYLNRTILRAAYNNAYPRIAYATERMRKILTAELARKESLDPPINVLKHMKITTHTKTAKTSRKTFAYEKYVFEELDSLAAKGGIDYTVVGRALFINDVNDVIGQGPALSSADFDGNLSVSLYGVETGTYSAVTDGLGKWGAFGGVDPYYGEIELLHTIYDEDTTTAQREADAITKAEMSAQARRNSSGRYPTPILIRVPEGATLRSDRADDMMDVLVPGVRFAIRSDKTYRKVTQVQKLDRLVVEEDSNGERVQVTFSPAPGTTPWDDSGETETLL
jgi:hypothetical protein